MYNWNVTILYECDSRNGDGWRELVLRMHGKDLESIYDQCKKHSYYWTRIQKVKVRDKIY